MTAQHLLRDLAARGVVLSADGDHLDVDAPDAALTDDLIEELRQRKAELLALLRSGAALLRDYPSTVNETVTPAPNVHPRPRLGSFARPMPARGTRMPMDCLWATCDGHLSAQGHNLHVCSNCTTWFELLPPQDLGVYVGDLADDDAGVTTPNGNTGCVSE